MDDEDEDSIDQPRISPKKRKIANGQSMPVKTDKKSREEALRLLKQRMKWKHKRSSSIASTLSSTQSSSPKSTSTWSHPHTVNKNGSRRVSASKYTGRRSHALNLAAKSSLNISPRRIVCLSFFISSLSMLVILSMMTISVRFLNTTLNSKPCG